MSVPWWVAVIPYVFGAVGVVLIGAGAVAMSRRRNARLAWPEVTGVVVSDSINSPNGVGGSESTIRFTTREGREIVARSSSYLRTGISKVGRTVPVWYDPEDPTRIYARVHLGDRSGLPLPLMGLAFVLVATLWHALASMVTGR